MKFKTKGISLLLSIAMLLSMFPATSFALNLGNTEFIKPGTTEANMPEMKTVAVKVILPIMDMILSQALMVN